MSRFKTISAGLALCAGLAAAPALALPVTYSVEGAVDDFGGWSEAFAPEKINTAFAGMVTFDTDDTGYVEIDLISMTPFTVGSTEFGLGNARAFVELSKDYIKVYLRGATGAPGDNPEAGTDDFMLHLIKNGYESGLGMAPETATAAFSIFKIANADEAGYDQIFGVTATRTGSASVTFTKVNAVPLPAAAPLLAAGLAGFALLGRRRARG